VFFDLEPGVIDAVRASPLGELFRPGNQVNHTHEQNGPKTTTEGSKPILLTPYYKAPSTRERPDYHIGRRNRHHGSFRKGHISFERREKPLDFI
jgi:hypothetical protein